MPLAKRTASIIKMLSENNRVTVTMLAEQAGKDPAGYAFKSAMSRARKVLANQHPPIDILVVKTADGWFLEDKDKQRAMAFLEAQTSTSKAT